MSIELSKKVRAFGRLSRRARLHIELVEARTDYQKLLEAITYNEPSLVKFYLDAGVSVNPEAGSITSPLFHAAVMQNPLITKMLLEAGANPGFEHRLTHATIVRSLFRDYDWFVKHNPAADKLDNLALIAAMMRNAGQRFDAPNSRNELPMDGFGLWVGAERKEQVLAEFLEKIERADIHSIRAEDVVARLPEEITRLSPEEERQVALYQAGRYDDLLKQEFHFTTLSAKVKDYFTHFSAVSTESSDKRPKTKPFSEETSKLDEEVMQLADNYISMLRERNDQKALMNDESKGVKERAFAARDLYDGFFKFRQEEVKLLSRSQLLLSRLTNGLDESREVNASNDPDLSGSAETLSSSTRPSHSSLFCPSTDATMRMLVRKYKLPDQTQASFEKGLRNAAVNNFIEDVKSFLTIVKNIDAVDDNLDSRRTALIHAARKGHLECYQLLIERGANPEIHDASGNTAQQYLENTRAVVNP